MDIAENEQALRTGTEGFEWLDDGRRYVWLSDRDGWRHAYSAGLDGSPPRLLTPGDYDVISTQAIDPNGQWIYFLAAPRDATQRLLYRAALDRPGPAVALTPASQARIASVRHLAR